MGEACLRNCIVILILEWKEGRAGHRRTEERRLCLATVRYNVLHDGPRPSGFAPDRNFRGVAAKGCDLTYRSVAFLRI